MVPARGDDKGPWRLAVGKALGQRLLGGSLSPSRTQDPCSPLSVARASGFPSQSRAGSGPLLLLSCEAAPALPCLGVFPRRRILSHHCPGLIQAVQPPHTVRPCLTGAAHAQQLVSMAVSTEALATLETHCLQTS